MLQDLDPGGVAPSRIPIRDSLMYSSAGISHGYVLSSVTNTSKTESGLQPTPLRAQVDETAPDEDKFGVVIDREIEDISFVG